MSYSLCQKGKEKFGPSVSFPRKIGTRNSARSLGVLLTKDQMSQWRKT